VIASNYNFMLMGKTSQEVVKVRNILRSSAMGHIAGKY